MMTNIAQFNEELSGANPVRVLSWALEHFGSGKVAFASSLGAEDQVLTDMLLKIEPRAVIFTLDTGRLPQETYDCMGETMRKYGFRYEVYAPDNGAVEKMVSKKGPNLFYENAENRELCCRIRKVEPLKRALEGKKAWICGLRREQSLTRAELNLIEWDDGNRLYKINPLIHWTEKQVWDYIRGKDVPYNKLHDQGYSSIGCAPCTRAVKSGEDVRAGRWWWESPEKKECGLHLKEGKLKRVGW